MDWSDFFERTRVAAGVESFAKLAPKLGITDGAIGHYRQGRQIPSVWVVADCLKIQGHPTPEKAAVEIMRNEARTSTERTFWKRLLASTAMVLCAIGFSGAAAPEALAHKAFSEQISSSARPNAYYVKADWGWWAWLLRQWLAWRLRGSKPTNGSLDACQIA